MSKKTEWYIETPRFVVAEKLGGGPFIVSKKHEEGLSKEKWERAEHLVGLVYDDFDLRVVMRHCPDHWHAHIVTDETLDLSNE